MMANDGQICANEQVVAPGSTTPGEGCMTEVKKMHTVTVEMTLEKETKGTKRFRELNNQRLIGSLYVPKLTLEKLGDPAMIRVSVTPGCPHTLGNCECVRRCPSEASCLCRVSLR